MNPKTWLMQKCRLTECASADTDRTLNQVEDSGICFLFIGYEYRAREGNMITTMEAITTTVLRLRQVTLFSMPDEKWNAKVSV